MSEIGRNLNEILSIGIATVLGCLITLLFVIRKLKGHMKDDE